MIVTEEVQKAMEDQNPEFRGERMAEGPRLPAGDPPGNDDFTERAESRGQRA
jgi:hypothetical protein